MKKVLAVFVLILVAAVAAVPFASGLLLERTVRSTFDNLNAIYAETGVGYSLEVVNIKRGYTSSEIDWKISLGPLKAIYQVDEIIFSDHAQHGFTGIVSTTSLKKNPWYAKFVADKLKGKDPIKIVTTYGLQGDIESVISWDAFSVAIDDESLTVQPGEMTTSTDKTLKEIISSGTWQGASLGEALSIGPVSLASDLEMISTYIWDGDVTMDIQNIKIDDDGEQMGMKAMTVSYILQTNSDHSRLNGEAWVGIEGLVSEELKVENASVGFISKGVDTAGYEAFMKMYMKTVSTTLASLESLDKEDELAEERLKQQMTAEALSMAAAYEKLLKAGLEFQLADLRVKLPDSEITGDIALRLQRDMTFMDFAPVLQQPTMLLDVLYLKSDFSLPTALVGEIPNMLNPLFPGMQTGVFVKKGDYLVHQAETVDGKLMLNGKEVKLTQ